MYKQASGQCVNFYKSAAYFSKNTQDVMEQQICSNFGVIEEDHQFTYLGIPVGVGKSKKRCLLLSKRRFGKGSKL